MYATSLHPDCDAWCTPWICRAPHSLGPKRTKAKANSRRCRMSYPVRKLRLRKGRRDGDLGTFFPGVKLVEFDMWEIRDIQSTLYIVITRYIDPLDIVNILHKTEFVFFLCSISRYSESLDVVNKRLLQMMFTISRVDCIS